MPRAVVYAWLAVGVASVSAVAIFIRLADTNPITFAAYRMLMAAAIVVVPTLLRARGELFGLTRPDLLLLSVSGLLLATHFAVWTASLSLTSVASSVLLVTMSPIFVAAGSLIFLRERVRRMTIAAVAISLVGGVILAFGDLDWTDRRLLGDGLALSGAVAVGAHLLIGRKARRTVGNLPYITVVYITAAVALLAGALISGAPMLGLPAETYFWIFITALVPQAVGHSLLNWSLAHVSATNVALAVRAEPIVATLVAIPVLGETPSWMVIPGGALILFGVYLALKGEVTGAADA
ncbi:MAG: DMT family transporter [Chloroflexi bacterium]|nr:DMT family transporter [Chloroflexota bacterium]MDA1174440.1 DMT family transporter [Chloroflexota bacterium]